jgi:hypothetical protein
VIVAAKLRHTKKQNNSSTHSDSPGKIGKSFRGVAQLAEQRSPKPCVAGSNPVTPAKTSPAFWRVLFLWVSGANQVRLRTSIASEELSEAKILSPLQEIAPKGYSGRSESAGTRNCRGGMPTSPQRCGTYSAIGSTTALVRDCAIFRTLIRPSWMSRSFRTKPTFPLGVLSVLRHLTTTRCWFSMSSPSQLQG